jgi:hypothetical protein
MLEYGSQLKKPQDFRRCEQAAAKLADCRGISQRGVRSGAVEGRLQKKMKELIEKKVASPEIVAPPAEATTQVINLMDALKQSLAKVQPTAEAKPPKKVAASVRKAPGRARKKKSG